MNQPNPSNLLVFPRAFFISSHICVSSLLKQMSTTELIYFNGAGRAEVTRILLHAAGVDFTDTRMQGGEWPTIKPTTPLGSVPVLKIDGVQYCQSGAMTRYAARLAGFFPTDPLEGLVCDEALECLGELMSEAPKGGTPEELKEKRQAFQHGKMTKIVTLLESRIQAIGGGTGFCKEPCVADLALESTVKSIAGGSWDHIDVDFFDKFPGIKATCAMIAEHEKVKAYYASLAK
jgi:glutathione S-transferase